MTFSNEIITVLEYLCTKLGVTIDWTAENVTPYLQDLCTKIVNYEFWTSVAWIGFCILPVILALILFIKFNCGDTFVIFLIVALICLAFIGAQIFDIIECKVFPEKAIYDFIQFTLNNIP